MTEVTTREHDHEPVPGLPGNLPDGEYIVWQGRPDGGLVARRVLKVRWLAAYMLALAAWAVIAGINDGRTTASIVFSAGVLVAMGAVLLALLEFYAWAISRGTLYTLTNTRLVLRIGVGLTVTLNLPFNRIQSASVRREADGTGNIALVPADGTRLAWFILWPHSRPWHYSLPQPSMICLRDVDKVARLLAAEMQRAMDEKVEAAMATPRPAATRPSRPLVAVGEIAGQPT